MEESDNRFEGFKLPGLEVHFPRTWPGAFSGFVICLTIAFIAYIFLIETDKDTQQSIIGKVPDGNGNKIAKLELSLQQKDEAILSLKDTLVSLQSDNLLVDSISGGDETKRISESKKITTKISQAVQKAGIAYNKRPSDISNEEVVISISDKSISKNLVTYFLNKRHWFTQNYYWVTIAQLLDDNKKGQLSAYSVIEIESALIELVDLNVLAIKRDSNPIKYGLQQGAELEQFKLSALGGSGSQ